MKRAFGSRTIGVVRRWVLGRETDPWWARPGLLAVLALSALAYLWALDSSGFGNEYYAAAAYSGSHSWTAWLFGSFDSASFISVDKPPLSLWVTGLSIRVFGLSSWSVLAPQAIAGVAAVGILARTVRSWRGHATALLAATAFALTPVVVVMFRYNNPDAMLTLVSVAALAAAFTATQTGNGWWLMASGILVGLAFLTKTTQALLVIPAIGLVYLVCAPVGIGRRLLHGAGAAVSAVIASGWWILLAQTSESAPYFGQTRTGSFLDYVLGVNGLDRITSSSGAGPGGGGQDPFGGTGGWGRLFNLEVGGQISWLIPLALGGIVVFALRRPRGRMERAGWAMWTTAFVTHFLVFSLMKGVFHPYYSMTMAPSIAVLAAAGASEGWTAWRTRSVGWWMLPAGIVVTALWAWTLLGRTDDFVPWLGPIVAIGAVVVATLLVVRVHPGARMMGAIGALAAVVVLAGPLSYSLASIGVDHSGGDPKAGPTATRSVVSPGPDGDRPERVPIAFPAGERPVGPPPGGRQPNGIGARPVGSPDGAGGAGAPGVPDGAPGPGARAGGDLGVLLDTQLIDYLVAHRGGETWLAATIGTRTAAQIILAAGDPVMAMGGFSGGDPTPTGDELAGYIDSGALRFVYLEGTNRNPQWTTVVQSMCRQVDPSEYGGTVGGASLFDCATGPSTDV